MSHESTIHDWARRLIASEIGASLSAESEIATLRVYERLRRQLLAPVGEDGFQALASRALSLTKSRSQGIDGLHILANGGLSGLSEVGSRMNSAELNEVGIVLIERLLGLFITLLGEAATVHFLESAPLHIEARSDMDTIEASTYPKDINYLGPFEDILLEAKQLRNVSERLETLACTYVDVEELMSVAGNIRTIANVLDIFTLVRDKGGASEDSVLNPSSNRYMN